MKKLKDKTIQSCISAIQKALHCYYRFHGDRVCIPEQLYSSSYQDHKQLMYEKTQVTNTSNIH